MKKIIKVRPTGEYPCQWDDLIDEQGRVIATIYTEKEAEEEGLKFHKDGISKGRDGIYNIVVPLAQEINNEVVRNRLELLSKRTKKEYKFVSRPSLDDKIIKYADRLIKPLEKYGNIKDGYNFSKAKTPKQKTEVIRIWIGEILYEAMTYKDVKSLKSLVDCIKTEIQDLIKEDNGK